jgi:anti-repressor protein
MSRAVKGDNSPKAIRDHVDSDDKLTERIVLAGQHREVTLIKDCERR